MKTKLKELLVLHFLNDGIRTTLIVFLPFITKDLYLSLTQAGFLGSAQPLIAALLAIPTGYVIGRFGGLRIIFILLIIYSLATLGIASSFNGTVVFFMYLIAAIGFGMFHTVGFTLVGKISDDGNMGRNMGNFFAIGEIGRLSIPPLAIFAVSFMGWRPVVAAFGILGILLFIISRFLPNSKDVSLHSKNQEKQNHKEFLVDIFNLFKNKRVTLVTLGAIIDSIASSPIYVYLPFLLLAKHISTAELSIAMGVFFMGSLIGKKFLGVGVDKFGDSKVFIISEICMALSLVIIVQNMPYFLLLFLSVSLGIFSKGTSPVVQTMFSTLSHKDHYHKIFAISETTIGLAAAIAIILLGGLADATGIYMLFYTTAFFAILATVPIYAFSKMSSSRT